MMTLLETCKALLSAVEDFSRWHPSGELEGLIVMGKEAIANAKTQPRLDDAEELADSVQTVLDGFRYEKGRPVMAEWKMKETLEKALANYRS